MMDEDALRKQIAHAIWSGIYRQHEEPGEWEERWRWSTDPDTLAKGGPWDIMVATEKVFRIIREMR
jgi:hypothetical protein